MIKSQRPLGTLLVSFLLLTLSCGKDVKSVASESQPISAAESQPSAEPTVVFIPSPVPSPSDSTPVAIDEIEDPIHNCPTCPAIPTCPGVQPQAPVEPAEPTAPTQDQIALEEIRKIRVELYDALNVGQRMESIVARELHIWSESKCGIWPFRKTVKNEVHESEMELIPVDEEIYVFDLIDQEQLDTIRSFRVMIQENLDLNVTPSASSEKLYQALSKHIGDYQTQQWFLANVSSRVSRLYSLLQKLEASGGNDLSDRQWQDFLLIKQWASKTRIISRSHQLKYLQGSALVRIFHKTKKGHAFLGFGLAYVREENSKRVLVGTSRELQDGLRQIKSDAVFYLHGDSAPMEFSEEALQANDYLETSARWDRIY